MRASAGRWLRAWLATALLALAATALRAGDEPVRVDTHRFRGEMGAALRSSCELGTSLVGTYQRASEEHLLTAAELRLVVESVWRVAFHLEYTVGRGRSLLPAAFHAASRDPLARLIALCHDAQDGRVPLARATHWLQAVADELAQLREAASELEPVMSR